MYDIRFYMETHDLRKKIMGGEQFSRYEVWEAFESARRKEPVVYNIETTNACPMTCQMCPRTQTDTWIGMTRAISDIQNDLFKRIADQLSPWTEKEWKQWEEFVSREYKIAPNSAPSENHFFLYVIPKVIQLHGYGEPLVDKALVGHVEYLSKKGLPTYFSCNPSLLQGKRVYDDVEKMMSDGLSYIKFSIESTDDEVHKHIRGSASNFTQAFERIEQLLEIRDKNNYKTAVVITMLDLGPIRIRDKSKRDGRGRAYFKDKILKRDVVSEYNKLKNVFSHRDVYLYLKSQDQQWLDGQNYRYTHSVHWGEICKHPWMSMTIKSDGKAAMCMEDYDNAIELGDVNKDNLYNIWNGPAYEKFRKYHFDLETDLPCKFKKCTAQCDMAKVGSYLSNKTDDFKDVLPQWGVQL